jgi:hypothetical protein
MKKIKDKISSFHYKVDFSNDVKSFVIAIYKKCYGLLLHNKYVLIVSFFLVWLWNHCNAKIRVFNQI